MSAKRKKKQTGQQEHEEANLGQKEARRKTEIESELSRMGETSSQSRPNRDDENA
jgi:hypothetical protein